MRTALSIALLAAVLPASGQESASFLSLGAGARGQGMGGAYSALADEPSALAWNPAGLSGLGSAQAAYTHAELPAQARYDFIAFAQPTKLGTLGAGLGRLGQGGLEARDESGRPQGGFSAADTSVHLAFSRPLGAAASLGAAAKAIESRIGADSARTYAFDLGGTMRLGTLGPGAAQAGASVRNLGPGLKFADQSSPLPLTFAGGLAYRLPAGLLLAADLSRRPHARTSEWTLGTEYALAGSLSFRAGYAARTETAGSGTGSLPAGLAAGFGLKVRRLSVDYAVSPAGELGTVHRLALGGRF